MAGPADTLNALNNILSELKKMGASTAKAIDQKRQSSIKKGGNRQFVDYTTAIDKLEKNTVKLDKTFKQSQESLQKSTKSVAASLTTMAKDALTPGASLKKAVKDWKDSLDQMVKTQNADYQRLAKNTRDYIHNNKTSGVSNIRNANSAFKDSMNVLRNISKNHGKISQEDAKAFKSARGKMTDSLKGGHLRVLQDLNKKQLDLLDKVGKGGKLTVAQLKDLSKAAETVNKNFLVMNDVTEKYSAEYAKTINTFRESLLNAVKGIGAGISQVLGAAVPQIYKDVMAQAQNAVKTSQYKDILKMGISEEQAAQFIGQNRLALRTLGGGSSTAPLANGQLNQLQNQAHNFGLTGNDALKYIGSTFDNLIRMGLTPTVKNTTQAMDVFYKTMQETGMSFDQLNGMVEDLSKSAAFTDLVRANGYKGQPEQIEILSKLLATSRYSATYLKDMLEMNKQAKFQGIAEMVKGRVGISLTSNLLRQYGGNVSPLDEAVMQMQNNGMSVPQIAALMKGGKLDQYKYNGKKVSDAFTTQGDAEQFAFGVGGRINEAKLGINNRLASQGGGLGLGLFNSKFAAFSDLMGNMGKIFNPDEALQAQASRQGLFGTINPTAAQQQELLGANDHLIKSINDVDNAFATAAHILPGTMAKIAEAGEGAQKNPAVGAGGSVMSGIGKVLGNTLEVLGIGGGLLSLKPALGAKLGWLGRGASALGRLIPSIGAGTGALLGSGAATATGVGLVGGAAGYGLGTVANKLPELWGGEDVGTHIGDWLSPDYDTSKVYPGYHSNNGSPSITKQSPDNNPITADTTLTPQGDTQGDLMSMSVDRLTDLVKIGRDQLELMQKAHDEHMEALSDQQNAQAIDAARKATFNSLVAGH